jgi:alkylation response protein AidB-like acyl-CoA dehydrogenase
MYIPIPMSDEHAAMSSTVRQLLDRGVGMSDVRNVLAIAEQGVGSSEIWKQAAAMGLPGVTIPEEYGGMGGGAIDTFVAFRAWGRTVHPSPLFSSVAMAAPLVLHAGSVSAREEFLPAIAMGTTLASAAIFDESTQWAPDELRTTASPMPDGRYQLSGHKRFVLDLPSADVIFVVARADFGVGVFAVQRDDAGVRVEPLNSLDLTRSVGDLVMDDAAGRLVSDDQDCSEQVSTALGVAALALIADSIGGAEAVLDMAVSYAKVREQFGRPIGSFQALKHKLADLTVTVESMISAGWAAAEQLQALSAEGEIALLLAKVYCAQGYYQVARANIQIHGGIGFTWEHPAHLYFRRALSNSMVLGDTESDRAALYSLLVAPHLNPGAFEASS